SGKLTESFAHLVRHVTWEDALHTRIKKAARYPVVVLIVITGMLMFMMAFVVPGIVDFLKSNGQELPPITKALIATSNFVVNFWWVILLTPIVSAATIFGLVSSSDKIRYAFSCFSLRLPVFGGLITKLAISRFAH